MIEVKNLSKKYGEKQAVNNISFKVEQGEILGFLGPNGAGKSTTMNMLTGYISSTSGQILVNGVDILEDPKNAYTAAFIRHIEHTNLNVIVRLAIKDSASRIMSSVITLYPMSDKRLRRLLNRSKIVYKKESIVVDTHMIRISNRMGLVDTKDPYKIELALKKIVPVEEGSDFCHRIVLFGRDICPARKPKCSECSVAPYCKKVGVK